MADSEFAHEEIAEIESALLSLAPGRSRVDRDHVMFAAGEEFGRRSAGPVGLSSMVAVLGFATAALMGTLWFTIRSPRVVREVVYVDRADEQTAPRVEPQDSPGNAVVIPEPSRIDEPMGVGWVPPTLRKSQETGEMNYLQLRDLALWRGVDALPPRRVAAQETSVVEMTSRRELLDELLQSVVDESAI